MLGRADIHLLMAFSYLAFRALLIAFTPPFLGGFRSNCFGFGNTPSCIRCNGLAGDFWLNGRMVHREEVRLFMNVAVRSSGMAMAIFANAWRLVGVVLIGSLCIEQERLATFPSLLEL